MLGVPELADDPRFARNEDRTANRDELRPLLVERLRDPHRRWTWFRDIIAAGVPCGPINTVDGGVAFAEEVGLDPVVDGRATATGRGAVGAQPDQVLRDPAGLPAAAAGARRARRRDPRAGWPRQPTGRRSVTELDGLDFPTSLGTSTADEIRLLGQDLTADLMGKVGFGELAFWLVAHAPADARRRPGSSRRCWWRWPTTASPRPRSPPG